MNTIVIPAPRPADDAEPPVKNTFFWPDVNLQQLRNTLRYEGTVTDGEAQQAAAVSEAEAEKAAHQRGQQHDAGVADAAAARHYHRCV